MLKTFLESGGFINRDVQVGISRQMDPAKSHGSITVRQPSGVLRTVHFTVDRPELLKNPTFSIISDMYDQFQNLGYKPEAIEVRLGGRVNVYETEAVH